MEGLVQLFLQLGQTNFPARGDVRHEFDEVRIVLDVRVDVVEAEVETVLASLEVVERDKRVMGPYAAAGQLQQRPTVRGGAIIRRQDWMLWDEAEAKAHGVKDGSSYPPMDTIIASLDTAYTEKQENDASYLTIWGVWQRSAAAAFAHVNREGMRIEHVEERDTVPAVMLMYAKEMRLAIHGEDLERNPGEYQRLVLKEDATLEGDIMRDINRCVRGAVRPVLREPATKRAASRSWASNTLMTL